MKRCLGKLPAKHDPRTLRLSSALGDKLPDVPDEVDWAAKVPSAHPIYANDRIGDCAIVTVANARRTWTANDAAKFVEPTEPQVIEGYSRCGGYPQRDQGCVMLDVMNVWRREGLCGAKIGAFAKVDAQSRDILRVAIHAFGGCALGVQLPMAAESRDEWLAPTPDRQSGEWRRGSWGGHAVWACGYDQERIQFLSWGKLMLMSWLFYESYNDEAYVGVSADWLGPDYKSPSGVDIAVLLRDAAALGRTA